MRGLGLLLGVALLAACANAPWRGVASPGVRLDPAREALTRTAAGLTITVEASPWPGRPRRLSGDYLPFRITVRNETDRPFAVPAPLLLAGDHGRTAAAIPPAEIEARYLGQASGRPHIGVGAAGPSPTVFGVGIGVEVVRESDVRDVRRLALPETDIPAGGEASGFVYFARPPEGTQRVTVRLQPSTGPPLEFPFRAP